MSQPHILARLAQLRWIRPALLILAVVAAGVGLTVWKHAFMEQANAAAANQPEPTESVAAAIARQRDYSVTTTSIGTMIALRSITLRNEIPGTVRMVHLVPGQVVEPGALLVALDVSVEEAELKALEAQADLAKTQLARMQRMNAQRVASEMELDQAHAERDVAVAQIARTKAIIARKTIRAPFRARVGISDVHSGQFLNEGTQLTTLQGVDDYAFVDFTVAQQVAAALREGDSVEVFATSDTSPTAAAIVAIDAKCRPVDAQRLSASARAERRRYARTRRICARSGTGRIVA